MFCAVKFTLLLLVLLLLLYEADAMFVWTAPRPAWNQTIPGGDSANIHTAVLRVLNGSTNFNLTWRYCLEQTQSISLTTFIIDDGINLASKIGVVAGGVSTVVTNNDYNNRFEIQSNAEFSSLAIKLVTERENATFRCSVLLTDGNEWAYNVRIEVTGPPEMTKPSKGTWEVTAGESVIIESSTNAAPKNVRSPAGKEFLFRSSKERTATDTAKYILIGAVGSAGCLVVLMVIAFAVRRWCMKGTKITKEESHIKGFRSCRHQWLAEGYPLEELSFHSRV